MDFLDVWLFFLLASLFIFAAAFLFFLFLFLPFFFLFLLLILSNQVAMHFPGSLFL